MNQNTYQYTLTYGFISYTPMDIKNLALDVHYMLLLIVLDYNSQSICSSLLYHLYDQLKWGVVF